MNSILTVTTPASSKDLTDKAAVKARLGITGATEDAQIDKMITAASVFIEGYCRRVFVKETVSEQFRTDICTNKILLSRFPIVAITSITEIDTVLTGTDYEADKTKGILYRLADTSYMEWGQGKITFLYQAGYALADVPADLANACIRIVTDMRSAASRDPLAKRIEIPDVETVDYWVGNVSGANSVSGLPPDIESVLNLYRSFDL